MSDKIKKSPQIRFVGFTDTWEQRKAEEIFKTVSDKGHTELPVLSASQQLGMVRRDENGIDIQYDKKSVVNYKRVLPKQFVIHLRSFQGGFAHSSLEGITSPAYTIIDFKPENNQSDLFWKEIFTSKKFIKNLETVTYGIRDGRSISFNDFKTLLFTLPSYKEQEQIAGFFNDLNNFITLHQRELELLKETKKSLLQKMFPKDGANVPEIRFGGFADAWEQRELKDVVDVRSGRDYKHLSDGDIPVYGTGGYMLSVNEALSYDKDAIGIGRKGTIDKPYLLRAPFWTVDTLFYVVPKEKNNLDFVHSVFQRVNWKQKDESTGVPSLSKTTINAVNMAVPECDEQAQIGHFFSQLDNLITLHQRELNSLKNLKKSLLQQMFI